MQDVLKRIGELRIVPVVAIEDAADATGLGDALVSGNLPIAEITFRTSAAEAAIRTLAKRPELLVGAGTVLNIDTAKRAVDAGAKFIVSPGFNPKVVSWCVQNKVPITPGTSTPTDIEAALDHGLTVVKYFPAESLGGIKTIKVLAGPFGMVQFLPSGGISLENVMDYLNFPKVLACGGSWLATKELIAAKKFDAIADNCRKTVALVKR